ncbi:unnamed protein product [Plutella xylostella]|uniref:(diamondback moth) hypothetical protein n=1 Tax=Plutella xylostella TaxID=51655 RepID=A0A8S4E2H5_PLUXY|nr:unnamed protein product [Plutella xylostella]
MSSTVAPVLQKRLEGLMMCMVTVSQKKKQNFDLQNKPRGRPETKVDNEELKAIVEADPSQTTSELAAGSGVSDKTILIHLKQIGKVKKLERPPYNCDGITVCFADIKRYPLSARDAAWLRSRRVPVCAPVVLSTYLTDDARPNVEELCLPEFRP